MFLTLSSCNIRSLDLDGNDHRIRRDGRAIRPAVRARCIGDPQCFDPDAQYATEPLLDRRAAVLQQREGLLLGGRRHAQHRAGRRQQALRTPHLPVAQRRRGWCSRYEQRNVLGLSSDFAEDHTKTNWGVEFTYIEDIPFINNDSFVGVSDSDALNLTVSVDRPTFINFLNPNRTFFFNSQWFVSYLTDWDDGYTVNGPWNVLFTFAMFTGYFQDRVQPQFVTVYDFRSAVRVACCHRSSTASPSRSR